MKTKFVAILGCLLMAFSFILPSFAQTSWKGTTSTNWATASNWTAGIPVATTDVIIGDANFTGAFQPAISATATASSLTIGGVVTSQLTVASTLTVKGNININSNGTLNNGSASISLTGNWNNGGTYTTTSTNSTIIFNGTVQSLGGVSLTTFRKLTVNTGSVVTLTSNLTCTGASSLLTVSGTLNPNESPSYAVTADNLTVNSSAVLKVNASVFTSNYIVSTSLLLNSGSIVEYSATAINQTVSSSYTYSTLRISGAGIKSLSADLPALRSTSSSVGNIYVLSATFDLSTFLANRGITVAGGTISVSNGAYLKIGGTNTFPASYTTNTLSLTSTVEYNGGSQAVAAKTYGNLTLTSSGGAAIKTMPATAFTIAGSLTSSIGLGTSVSYAAASNITVTGSVNIGASTAFDGATFSHTVTGSWNNSGTFTSSTSTITLKGSGAIISGNATQNFYNLTITASNVTAPAITAINIAGNLATSGSGALTQASGILTMSGTTKTLTGINIVLNSLAVTGVVTTTCTATVTGDINVSGSLIASSGIITMSGSGKVITNSGTLTFKGLLISGSVSTTSSFSVSSSLNNSGSCTATAGTITFTSSCLLSGTVGLYNVTINGSSLILAGNAVLGIASVFTITAGSLNVTTNIPNTVNYNGTIAQTIKGTGYNNLILSNGNTKTAGAAIIVNNTLTIGPSTTFDASTFTHTILGNWVNNGTFTAGTSLVQFTGATNSTISGASTFNNITVNKSLTTYTVTLLNSINVSTINMTLGSLYTGSNSITITTTRTGNGIILGTITRTHTFTTATAYAFEGPNNIITFASVSGVTSVTVNVTVANIVDFPYNGAIGRCYTITVPSGTYTATLRLHYEDAELNGNDETIMQLWKYNGSSWAVSGKTANSATLNYVEKSGLTNITNRWSLTDDGNVLNWNGSVSSDWSNASNWTLVQGTFSGAPGINDIAQIGVVTFTTQPIINTVANAKSITFGSAKATTLTLNAGGSLTTYGNIGGTWSSGVVHTINTNSQTLTVNGDLSLSDNTNGDAINLNIGTGTVTVLGSVTQSGNAGLTFSGAGTLNIGKDFIYSNGTFTPGTGTVKYNGSVSQIVAGVSYNNLTVNKTAGTIATLSNAATIAGSLVVTTGEFDVRNTLTTTGSVTISAGAVLDGDGSLMNVGASWSKAATGTFNAGAGTVNFNGSGAQTISAGAFNILYFNKSSGTATLSGNNTVNGDLSLLSGTLDLATFTLNQASAGDVFTIADGSTLLLAGANNFPSNFTAYTIGTNSLVHYNGTIAQSVGSVTYGNITFSNGGALEKTFLGSVTVNGNLTINSGASLNSGNFVLTLLGNWTNNGGTFTPGTGDILLNGTGKTLTGNSTFNDVTVNGSYTVATSDMTFNGQFLVTSTGSYTAGSGVATLNGDLTNSGSLTSTGTTTFTGTSLQTIRLINALISTSTGIVNFNGNVSPVFNSTTTPTFATVNINNTAGINPSVGWLVLVAFNVSNGGIFNGGVSTHTIRGAFTNNGTVTSSGTLNFNPVSSVTLQLSGTTFSSTGTVSFGGSGAITITGTPTSLQDVIIANTNATGITPPSAWTINGKFSINSNAIFNGSSFSHTVGGDIESDGILNGNTSTFTMSSPSGQLSGSPGTLFHNFTVTGSITSNSDFYVDGDFMNNGTYDGSIGALIMTGTGSSVVGGTTTPSAIAQLTVSKTGGAVVTQNVNINSINALIINSGTLFTSTYNLFQNASGGVLIIYGGATLKLGGTNTLPAFSGYGLDVQSTVDYAGTTQSVANSATYGNLNISAAGNKTTPSFLPITVAGNFTITAGNFVANNNTHKIAGNWIMSGGTFNNTNSVIRFNGTTSQDIQTIAPFNSIDIAKTSSSGIVTLSTDITVNAILNFISGEIQTGTNKVIIPSTGNVTGASQSTGWVNGILQKNIVTGATSKTFQIGDVLNYTPATVAFGNVTTPGNLISSVTATDHPNLAGSGIRTDRSVNRYWSFANSGIAFTNASVTINWVSTDVDAGATPANFKAGAYNSPIWTLPIVVSPLATSIQATGLTSFGDFTAGEICTLTSTFSYTGLSYCSNGGIASPTITGTAGTFTSTTGLIINSSTGAVDLAASTPGTYIVTNSATSAGGCTSSSTTSITITTAPSATISYAGSPYCSNSGTASVTFSGSATGTYSSTTGLSINSTTGAVNLAASTAGTYTVTYTVAAASGCSVYSTTASITITAAPSATISYAGSPYCSNSGTASVTFSGTATGTYSSTTGLSINSATGAVNLAVSTAGTYTVTYTVAAASGCAIYSTTTSITITAAPSATISYAGSPFCSNTGTASVTFSGTAAGNYSALPAGASINSTTGAVNLAASAPGSYTITYTVAASGGCALYTTTAALVVNPNTWTGGISTDWYTAGNWSGNAVPALTCPDVTILAGVPYQPILNSGTFAIQNLYINSGASLTVSNATLQIAGTINNSGTFDVSAGAIEMNGSSSQTIAANAFQSNALKDLIISNSSSGGVVLGGALDVYGSVAYSSGGMKLVTNDFLTLKSTALNTAWIGDMTGNTITGKVTVERYISARKAWRFLSIPTNTSQTIKETWQEGATGTASNPVPGFGIQITGAAGTAAGFDLYSAAPSMKTYVPSTNTWIGVANTSTAGIKATDGYMTFIRGDRAANLVSSTPTQTVLRTKGDLYTGDQTPIVVSPGKFAAIGNPYASTLDMRYITKTGMKDFFYVWDPKLAGGSGYGGYQIFYFNGTDYCVTPGGGSYPSPGSASNYIESGQAFLIQASVSGGNLTFKEAAKTSGSAQISIVAGAPIPLLRANLYGVNADNSSYMTDGIVVNYDDSYSNGVDDMDAIKAANTSENLAIKTANKLLIVERRHPIVAQDTVFLNLTGTSIQKYRFVFRANNLGVGLAGFLEDTYLHTSTQLNLSGSTQLDFTVTSTPASYAANRFRIVFTPPMVLPLTFTSIKASLKNKNIEVEWQAQNESNLEKYDVQKSVDGNNFITVNTVAARNSALSNYNWPDVKPAGGNNYYRILSTDVNSKTGYSKIVKVFMGSEKTEITIYPNPVVNGIVNLRFTNQPSGIYQIKLLNKSGQVMIVKELLVNGNSSEPIPLNKNISSGIYQMEISKPGGTKTSINVAILK